MKRKLKKALIVCGAMIPLVFSAACGNKGGSSDNKSDESSIIDVVKYTVSLPTNQVGYTCSGAFTVVEGTDYTFHITINEGYTGKNMVVKVNGNVVEGDSEGNYVVRQVKQNLVVTVEGVYEKSHINLTKNSYVFNMARVTSEMKEKAYYLANATGFAQGAEAQVDVDLSEVIWDAEGDYIITYFLVNEPSVMKTAIIFLYENKVASNVNIELSDYMQPIVDSDVFGIVHNDFTLYGPDGHLLTAEEVRYDTNSKINFLSFDYIRTLQINTNLKFTIHYFEDEYEFTLVVSDNEEPVVLFSKEEGTYGFKLGGEISLPTASLKGVSAQDVEFKYYCDGEEYDPSTFALTEVGTYSLKIETYHKGVLNSDLVKEYTYEILENYEITDSTDLNSGFLFYNTEVFGKYFTGTTVVSTNPINKVATCTSSGFTLSNEFIRACKAKGLNYMTIQVSAVAEDGSAITAIPMVSRAVEEDIPSKDWWRTYFSQNTCDGTLSTTIDFNNIDLDAVPTWCLYFSFRTDTSGGLDVVANYEITGIKFSDTPIKPETKIGWSTTSANASIQEVLREEGKYQVNVTNLEVLWKHLAFGGVNNLYDLGYRKVEVSVTGNEHTICAYTNKAIDIPNYNHLIKKDGGSVELSLVDGYDYVAIMTTRATEGLNDDETQDGVENLTVTLTFTKPAHEDEGVATFDDWSSNGSAKFHVTTSDPDNGKFKFGISDMDIRWEKASYTGLDKMYAKGYRYVKIDISGNNHTLIVYRGPSIEINDSIDGYSNKVLPTAGSIVLPIDATNNVLTIMTTRGFDGKLEDTDIDGSIGGPFEELEVEVTLNTDGMFGTYEEEFAQGRGYSNLNGGKIAVAQDGLSHTITGSWQINFDQAFAAKAYADGFKTLTFDVIIGHELGGDCNYLQMGSGKFVTLDETGHGSLEFDLNDLAKNNTYMRGKTSSTGSYGDNIAGFNIKIYNVHISTEESSAAVQNARDELASIFYTESGCWRLLRHNGWGSTPWGEGNTTLHLALNEFFQFTNTFFQKVKTAGYTKLTLTVVSTGENDVDVSYLRFATDKLSPEYSAILEGGSGTITLDFTSILENLNENVTLYARPYNASNSLMKATFVISGFVFEE